MLLDFAACVVACDVVAAAASVVADLTDPLWPPEDENPPKVRDDLAVGLPLGVDEQHEAVWALHSGHVTHLTQSVSSCEDDSSQTLVLPCSHTVCLV